MPCWFNYVLLHPLLGSYDDDGSADLFSIAVGVKDVGRFEAAVIGVGGTITMIRITTHDSDGNLSPSQLEAIETIKAHLLAVLRLTYDVDVHEAHIKGTFVSLGARGTDGKPDFHIRLQIPQNEDNFDWSNVARVFESTRDLKPLVILLGDIQNGSLPLQYRFLSLYKAFEFEFKTNGIWTNGMKETLQRAEKEYLALNISTKKLMNMLHELRDRCAHIRTGSRDRLGIVGLPDKDVVIVSKLLPLLIKILTEHVSRKHPSLTFMQK